MSTLVIIVLVVKFVILAFFVACSIELRKHGHRRESTDFAIVAGMEVVVIAAILWLSLG